MGEPPLPSRLLGAKGVDHPEVRARGHCHVASAGARRLRDVSAGVRAQATSKRPHGGSVTCSERRRSEPSWGSCSCPVPGSSWESRRCWRSRSGWWHWSEAIAAFVGGRVVQGALAFAARGRGRRRQARVRRPGAALRGPRRPRAVRSRASRRAFSSSGWSVP